jgi:hypothetical protein
MMKRHIYSKASYEAMRLIYTYTKAVVAVVGYKPNILHTGNCVQGIVWENSRETSSLLSLPSTASITNHGFRNRRPPR